MVGIETLLLSSFGQVLPPMLTELMNIVLTVDNLKQSGEALGAFAEELLNFSVVINDARGVQDPPETLNPSTRDEKEL